jgi:Cu-processing system ATP-binding protein
MRQRLALAVACMPPVSLMLLDEPTANLDPEGALQFRALVREWRAQGRAVLLSTHVLSDVIELADRVIVLVGGRVVATETLPELRRRLGRFARLRVDVGRPAESHRAAALAAGASDARLNHSALIVTAPPQRRLPILERLAAIGPIRHFETEKPSVENVYLEYVKEEPRESGPSE